MIHYLPIAELEVNIFIILSSGFVVGFMSGLFGVGGGFLMTPILIFLGIPPATAVATEANQILGSSSSGAVAHGSKGNIDYEIGLFLLIGGIFGSTLGVIFFKFMRDAGNLDLIISILYILFLATIGTLMFAESALSMYKKEMRKWPHARSLKSIKDLALFRGSSVGLKAAEAFQLIREIKREK